MSNKIGYLDLKIIGNTAFKLERTKKGKREEEKRSSYMVLNNYN